MANTQGNLIFFDCIAIDTVTAVLETSDHKNPVKVIHALVHRYFIKK